MKVRHLGICCVHHAHWRLLIIQCVAETLEQKEARRRQKIDKAQEKEKKQHQQQAKAAERERYKNRENIGQYMTFAVCLHSLLYQQNQFIA
jgi:hypothetical protein